MPRRKKSSHENQSRSSSSINKDKPQQRYAANARERARMRVLSRAFCRLKTTLPWVPADTKLSKLDTLRLAASYIAHLKGILRDETLGTSDLHPAMSLTWPFGFNRPLGGTSGGSEQGGSLLGSDEDEDFEEEEEDNVIDEDVEDGESILSSTWEEVSPPTKDCVHLDTTSSRGRSKGRATRSSSSSTLRAGRSPRGKRNCSSSNHRHKNNNNNNDSTPSPQVHIKKESLSAVPSLSSTQNLSKQSVPPPTPILISSGNVGATQPLKQNHEQQFHHHLHPSSHEGFQNENNNNNVMFPHHHHHQHHHQQHRQQQHLVHETEDKLCISPSSGMMTVTNLENVPFIPAHNEVLVGIGAHHNHNNESFVHEMNEGGGFESHQSQIHQHSHHHNHHHHNHTNPHPHQHEMHGHHHIAPPSNPFAFGSNDLISIN